MPFWSIPARFARTPPFFSFFLLDVPWGGRSCRCCVTLFPLFRSDRFVSLCKALEYSKRCFVAPMTCVSFRFVYLHHTHLMCSLVFFFVLLKVPWGGRSCHCCVTLFPLLRSDGFVSSCKASEYSKRCFLAPITCVSFRFVYLPHTHVMCSLVFFLSFSRCHGEAEVAAGGVQDRAEGRAT
jgi:hypothetical protein